MILADFLSGRDSFKATVNFLKHFSVGPVASTVQTRNFYPQFADLCAQALNKVTLNFAEGLD